MKPRASLAAVFGATLLILAAGGCGRRPAPPPSPAPYVQIAVASYGSIEPSRSLAGVIAPYQNVAIQSTLAEAADAVYVREGDRVRAGQLLAQLDTSDLQAQLDADTATANSNHASTVHTTYQGSLAISQGVDTLRADEAAARQAQETLANDTRNLQRDQNLLNQGYISQQAVDAQQTLVRNDRQAVNTANSNVAAARAAVEANGSLSGSGLQSAAVQQSAAQEKVALAQAQQVRVQIAKAAILSPIDGVVVNRNINPGEYPGNRQIFTLQQVNPIYAVLHASSDQVARITNGTPATIAVTDAGGQRFNGRVTGILNQINPGSTDFQVKVLLDNPGERLRPGMVVQGRVATLPLRGVRVPVTAFTDDNHDAVMVVQEPGDTVKTVKVAEVGSDGSTSIVSGLASGTRLVSNGQMSLGDGEKVSFQP
jgi:HlyD family secretion protein